MSLFLLMNLPIKILIVWNVVTTFHLNLPVTSIIENQLILMLIVCSVVTTFHINLSATLAFYQSTMVQKYLKFDRIQHSSSYLQT